MRARFHNFRRLGRWLGLTIVLAGKLNAQTPTPQLTPVEMPFDFYAERVHAGKLPKPEVILGYETGESYADYGEFLSLLETYAAKSDRLKVFPSGLTNERRPMHVLAISSPRNLARLDKIKAANQRLADGRLSLSEVERDRLIAKQPIIVWLGYNIHGDEAAGTEAAMRVIYELLDSRSKAVERWLDEAVILINPCQNPDGRERFVTWARAHGRGRPETFAWEKENPWNVSGRLNHYYFDLNRDMVSMSQVESQHSGAAFLTWLPQVAADHHGETTEYFFPPAALPINPNLPAESNERWMDIFGQGLAAAFDRQSWMYYVRDQFDLFYPGYWDSWPALQGATGMTFETTAGGKEGTRLRRDDGTITTLRTAIAKHFTASLATIDTAVIHREARLRDFRNHFVSASNLPKNGDLRRVFLTDADAERRDQLGRVLLQHGLEVQVLKSSIEVPDALNYMGGEAEPHILPAGTWVIDLAQPKGHLARALLEPHTPVDEAFLQRQVDKNTRNASRGENAPTDGLEFYDITAWTLPLMYGVEAFMSADSSVLPVEFLARVPVDEGTLPTHDAKSAYVIPVGSDSAQQIVFDLLAEGYRVGTAVPPFDAGGRAFAGGSFIVRVERNPAELHRRIRELATARGADVVAVDTAFSMQGITGIGSESVFALPAPKILVATGDGVNPSSYGAISFLFEKTFEIDFVPVAVSRIESVDLSEFNVVIFPSGAAEKYGKILGVAAKAKLKTWVQAGGTMICLGGAIEMVIDSGEDWTSVKRVEPVEDDGGGVEKTRWQVPGALLRTALDFDHFLSFGYTSDQLPFWVDTDVFFTASETGTNVLTFTEESLWLSGVVWPDNTERLIAGTAAVVDEPLGDGHVILFSDEPGYRSLWHGTTRMLLNAILYGPGLRNDAGSYQP
jgi:hypothetical protein